MNYNFENMDSIIFDLDGTMWNSVKPICEAWDIILQKHPEISKRTVTEEDLNGCMGLPMYDISAKLFPCETRQVQMSVMDELCAFENKYLEKKGGILYPKLKETLAALSVKYKLYIVSNCQDGYIEAFMKAHDTKKYFLDTECWGRTRLPKGESNRLLIERNKLKHPVYVGDTQGDAQSAIDAGIPFIYAAYGFGEVKKYDARIDSFDELLDILN